MIIELEGMNDEDYGEYKVTLPLIAVISGFGEGKLHLVLRALQSVMGIHTKPMFMIKKLMAQGFNGCNFVIDLFMISL
jgi:hypothetical protein